MQELTKEQMFISLVVANPHVDPLHCALDRVADGLGLPEDRNIIRATRWYAAGQALGFSRRFCSGVIQGWDTCRFAAQMCYHTTDQEYRSGYDMGIQCWKIAFPNKW